MRLIFDLGHPAHYHLYKNAIKHLKSKGDDILIIVRNREDIVARLIERDGEEYTLLGINARGMMRKAVYMVRNDAKLLRIASKFKPDLFVSMGSPYSAHVSFLMRRPHLSFADTEISTLVWFLLIPFTQTMIMPTSFGLNAYFRRVVRVNSYKELAYLHPNYFKPKPEILSELGIRRDEKFAIIRFSAFDSSHDLGLKGLKNEERNKLALEISKAATVIVSSEVKLDPEIERFNVKMDQTKMHDLLSYATLYVGEGAVMASEASLLGVSSIFINPSKRGYLEDLERNGLLLQYHNPNEQIGEIITKSKEILKDPESRIRQGERRKNLLEIREDLTAKIIEEIERFRV